MPTKGLIDRKRIGQDILQSIRIHSKQVGDRLNASLAFLAEEGETFPDFIDFQHQLARLLELRLEGLETAYHVHLVELDDDGEPSFLRRQAADALYTRMVEVRELLRGVYGIDRANKLVGFSGETPIDPITLHTMAENAIKRLREPGPELPPQRLDSLQLDRNGLADELQPLVDELDRHIEDVKEEVRKRETSKLARDLAVESFDLTTRSVARIQIALDELAGFPTFAERIRLTLPSRGRRIPVTDDEPPQPEPDSEEPTPVPESSDPDDGQDDGPEPETEPDGEPTPETEEARRAA